MSGRVWSAVDVVARPEAVDPVETALNELGALGTEVDGLRKGPDEPLTISGFFDDAPDRVEVSALIARFLPPYGLTPDAILSIVLREVEETDWLAEWKTHWKPTAVGRFVIAPPWEIVDPGDKILIRVEPNMAFGTGTHETTQLCLDAIGNLCRAGRSVLDVGTGTGILAIGAAKLGCEDVLACDTDEASIAIAKENAILNNVDDRIGFFSGPVTSATPQHDIVLANLTLDVIEPILPMLLEKATAKLVLSGVLVDQEAELRSSLDALGIISEVHRSGEWISGVIDLAA
ncbi:MAG: 50S ribosomal protein L11 methyltransferase [Acidobacteria bacterium]|nr:50S ribosomal protein L11 methyltransferase [Acidobacteriota bacterium]